MLRKNWRPPITVLIIAMTAVSFYILWAQSEKEPIKIYKASTPEGVANSQPKPPPPRQTAERGHFHADGTFHADAHETSETVLPSGGLQSDGVWYPDNYTPADIAADLAGLPAEPGEEYHRRAMKHAVNVYIQKHQKAYPDCTEKQAVIDDAKRYAAWRLADQDYWDKYYEYKAESDEWEKEFDLFIEKYGGTIFYGEEISISDIQKMGEAAKAHEKKIRAQMERRAALEREKPIEPKPRHTH